MFKMKTWKAQFMKRSLISAVISLTLLGSLPTFGQEENPMIPSPPEVEQYMLQRVVIVPQPPENTQLSVPRGTTESAGGEEENPLLPYAEKSILPKLTVDETVTPDTTELIGERIDLDTGSVSFQQTDVSIPGNSNLEVAIHRTFRGSYWMHQNTVEFGDWKLDIPSVQTTLMTVPGYISGSWGQGHECSGELNPGSFYAGGNYLESHQYWNGDSLDIPGVSSDKLLSPYANLLQGNEAAIYKRVTKSNWRISCIDRFDSQSVKVGEGFRAESPDGKVYTFDQLRLVEAKPSGDKTWGGVVKYHAFMQVSHIEDRFGNWVNYNYDSMGRLATITANDGRSITLYYDDSSYQYQVTRIAANGRTWNYGYTGQYYARSLQSVTLPNNQSWSFSLQGMNMYEPTSSGNETCDFIGPDTAKHPVSITHPNGMTATFELQETLHGQTDVEYFPGYLNNVGKCFATMSVVKKTLTGDGVPSMVWTYSYSQNRGVFAGETAPSNSYLSVSPRPENVDTLNFKTTTVSAPDGSKTRYFFNRNYTTAQQGSQVAVQYFDTNGSSLLKTSLTNFAEGKAVGTSFVTKANNLPHGYRLEAVNKKVILGSTTYLTEYSNYDIYGVAGALHQQGPTGERYITQSFTEDRTNWRLNLPTVVGVSSTGSGYTTVKETTYKTVANTNEGLNYSILLPDQEKMYGTWRTRYASYHADGNVKRVEYNQPLINSSKSAVSGTYRYQELNSYKRGQPQSITIPARYNHTASLTASRSVDNNGWVTSTTDLNGNTTNYGYDSLGRLLYVDAPNDSNNWKDTYFNWSQTSGYAPVRTAQRCTLNASKTGCSGTVLSSSEIRFDSLLRPLLVTNTDTVSGVSRYQNKQFNAYNQETFVSNWSFSSNEYSGTTNTYDGLQRLTTVAKSGQGTEEIQYLDGNKQNHQDSRGYSTQTTYLAYGAPAYDQPLLIESPEGVDTTLSVNLYGDLTAISQSGPQVTTQTEYRAYDTNHYLCKITRTDVGTTVMANSLLGEVISQEQGVTSNSSTNCTATSNGNAVQTLNDNLGQAWTVTYPDTTPDLTYTNDNNGNLKTLVAGAVSHNYNYNSLNLVTSEQLNIAAEKSWALAYGYNSMGFRASMTYPDNYTVSYSPNGFGEPTAVVRGDNYTYAGGASYYANGALQSFSYGNGVTHQTTLNSQTQVPTRIQDIGIGSTLLDYGYGYDNKLNLTSHTDYKDSGYSLSQLNYDGLDRLISTVGGSKVGSSSLSYDGLGNIRSYSSKGRSLTYTYSNSNQLTSVAGFAGRYGSISYDGRGNVVNNGERSFGFNLANQLTTSAGNSYVYDGYNRRVKEVEAKGTSYSLYNQEGTLVYRETAQGGVNYIYLGKKLIAKDGFIPETSKQQHYRPFGESLEGAKDDVGYTGHKYDAELGLNYMQQRYYDPVLGRFYSNDPVGFTADKPMMFNRYAYANNNPYKFSDPDGRVTILIPVVAFIEKEVASEAVEQVTCVPMPTVKNLGKAAIKTVGKDTISETRKQALNQARKMNDVPKNAKMQQIKPNTPEGKAAGLDNRNVRAYQTENTKGDQVTIREDKAASYGEGGKGDQGPHFNVEVNGVDTKQHHNWEKVE